MTLLVASSRRRALAGDDGAFEAIPAALLANWDATALTGLADGQQLGMWADHTGTAHAVAAAGFGQPTYHSNQRGNLPAVRFTKASQQALAVDVIGALLAGAQPFTLFTVQRPTVGDTTMPPFALESSTDAASVHCIYNGRAAEDNSEHRVMRQNASGSLVKVRGSTPQADIPSGTWAITANRFTGTTDTAWINGAQKWAAFDLDVGSVSFDRATLGGWRSGSQFYDGDIGQVVIFAGALSDAEIKIAGDILAAKWDLWWGPYNTPGPLDIPVAGEVAIGEPPLGAMHPDVLDFGSAPFAGYRYWMAMTPYNGNEQTENPSVVVTNSIENGGTWAVPTGYTNPLTEDPPGISHMADTDIFYDETTGRLWVFYVTTNTVAGIDLRCKWTSGGGVWSSEIVPFTALMADILNPSIVKTATGWRMYYVKGHNLPYRMAYRDSSTDPGSGYGTETVCDLDLFSASDGLLLRPQNLNMVRDVDGTLVAVISNSLGTSLGGSLVFCRATDDGNTFVRVGPTVIDIPLPESTAWDNSAIYRASVVVDTEDTVVVTDGEIDCFYSARRRIFGTWGTAHVRLPVSVLGR